MVRFGLEMLYSVHCKRNETGVHIEYTRYDIQQYQKMKLEKLNGRKKMVKGVRNILVIFKKVFPAFSQNYYMM